MLVIEATPRDLGLKIGALRKSGKIPAVFYGAGKTSTSITIPSALFKKVWREAGESSAVKVTVGKDTIDCLIHEVQVDPITDEPIHADFLAIDMKKKIKVKVPIEFTGVSNAVKTGIGNIVKVLHEIEVEALPADLPHSLSADISKLETLDNNITVADIKLPTGVIAITNVADIVASVVAQVEEKEEVVVAPDLTAIEVEKKGKKEEEGAPGAEGAAPAVSAKEPAHAAGEKTEKK